MKLVHPALSHSLIDDEHTITEWIMEAQGSFTSFLAELLGQCQGNAGAFVLSEDEKQLDIGKLTAIIFDVLALDINERRLLSKLYTEMQELAYSEQFYVQTRELIQQIRHFILELEQETEYCLDFSEDVDLTTVFKAAGVCHQVMEDNLLERIVRYIRVSAAAEGRRLFVFIHLRSYLTDEQMQQLVRELMYQNVYAIFVENSEKACIKEVFRYMIDADLCEIYRETV